MATKKKSGKVLRSKSNRSARASQVKKAKKDISASYNKFKFEKGKFYTGMQVGRSHKWYYDKGEWKDTKITPDLWRISYAVTKRRAGKAPKGSGAAVGTGYHWYIIAHQKVEKLNADDYSTFLSGLKFKVAHKRATIGKWSFKTTTQRQHLIKFLKNWIRQLETKVREIEFVFNQLIFKGEAVEIPETCTNGKCTEWDLTLNDEYIGVIRDTKSGWKLEGVKDQKFINAIGEALT
jgi:hypothetical protein